MRWMEIHNDDGFLHRSTVHIAYIYTECVFASASPLSLFQLSHLALLQPFAFLSEAQSYQLLHWLI